jgi:hypothetical protein
VYLKKGKEKSHNRNMSGYAGAMAGFSAVMSSHSQFADASSLPLLPDWETIMLYNHYSKREGKRNTNIALPARAP